MHCTGSFVAWFERMKASVWNKQVMAHSCQARWTFVCVSTHADILASPCACQRFVRKHGSFCYAALLMNQAFQSVHQLFVVLVQFTCTYSSPERSNSCDQRKVDVWAAGCILYEVCTGKPFIKARTDRERFAAMAQFYDPSWQPPKLPRPMACWQPLLDAMMHRDPAKRPLPMDLLAFDIFACALTPPAAVLTCALLHACCKVATGCAWL